MTSSSRALRTLQWLDPLDSFFPWLSLHSSMNLRFFLGTLCDLLGSSSSLGSNCCLSLSLFVLSPPSHIVLSRLSLFPCSLSVLSQIPCSLKKQDTITYSRRKEQEATPQGSAPHPSLTRQFSPPVCVSLFVLDLSQCRGWLGIFILSRSCRMGKKNVCFMAWLWWEIGWVFLQILFECNEEMKKKTGYEKKNWQAKTEMKVFFGTYKQSTIFCYYSCRSKKYEEDKNIKEIIYINNTEILRGKIPEIKSVILKFSCFSTVFVFGQRCREEKDVFYQRSQRLGKCFSFDKERKTLSYRESEFFCWL